MSERPWAYPVTLVVGLLAAALVVVGVARPWASATARVEGLPTIAATVPGAELAPLAGALAVVLLASFGAVIATGGRVRQTIGVLIVCAAAVVVYSAAAPGASAGAIEDALAAKGWSGGGYDSGAAAWRWVVLAGGVVGAGAGAAIGRYGGRWATMGARYDAPTGPPQPAAPGSPLSEVEVWRAIDRGDDPTQRP